MRIDFRWSSSGSFVILVRFLLKFRNYFRNTITGVFTLLRVRRERVLKPSWGINNLGVSRIIGYFGFPGNL